MAKLECPKCDAVLNPAKPPAPGKKVRCPRCEAIFVVPDPAAKKSDIQKSPAPAKQKSKVTAKKSAPDKEKKKPDDDDDEGEGTYGFADNLEEQSEGPEEIDYAPDLESKNPRGPAFEKLAEPTTWLLRVSAVNLVASLVMILFWTWPFLFTPYGTTLEPKDYEGKAHKTEGEEVDEDPRAKFQKRKVKPDDLSEEENPDTLESDRSLWDEDVADEQTERALWAGLCFFLFLYFGVLCYAVVQMQNLESYNWAMTCCIMAIPIPDTTGFGIWGIRQLRNEEVKEAFFFDPETDL